MKITYEWKVDIAIIISLSSIIIVFIKSLFDNKKIKKNNLINSLENVYSLSCELLYYPHQIRKKEIKNNRYINKDKDLEISVNKYLTSIFEEFYFNYDSFIPKKIKENKEKNKFIDKVMNEAKKYRDKQFKYYLSITKPELSPVYYLNNTDFKNKFDKIVDYINNHLSNFPRKIQNYSKDIIYTDPEEIINNYNSCLRVCKNYFDHNNRNFDDPYYDLLINIRNYYKKLIKTKIEKISDLFFKFGIFFSKFRFKRKTKAN